MTKIKVIYQTIDGNECVRRCKCDETTIWCQFYVNPKISESYCKLWGGTLHSPTKLPKCIEAEVKENNNG